MNQPKEKSPILIPIPLAEMSIEVHFPGDLRVEQWRASFQQRIRGQYPKLLVPVLQPGVAPHPGNAPHLMHLRFADPQELNMVGVAINSLGLIKKVYPGWQETIEEFLDYWEDLRQSLGISQATRVGLRFQNHFAGRTWEVLKQPFTESCLLGANDENIVAHEGTFHIKHGLDRKEMVVRVALNKVNKELFIDFDAFGQNVDAEEVPKLLESCHNDIERKFLGLLREDYANKLLALKAK